MVEPSPRNLFAEGDVSAAILRKWWKGLQTDGEEREPAYDVVGTRQASCSRPSISIC